MAARLRQPPYVIQGGIILVRVHDTAKAAVIHTANVALMSLITRNRSGVVFTSMHAYINANTNQPSDSFTPSCC